MESSNVVALEDHDKIVRDALAVKPEEEFPLQPFDDICVIEQMKEDISPGGIFLPGDHRKFSGGRVVAAGPGRVYSNYLDASGEHKIGHFVPNPVKVGDWVTFGKYQSGGEPIEWKGRVFLMARAGDLGGKSKDGQPVNIRLAAQ